MNPALLLIAFGFAAQAHEPVDFLFDVRPILSEHCYTCHGPDDKARKADLRLDRPESFKKKLPSGAVLVSAGHPEESDLLQRLNSDDENEVMPPLAASGGGSRRVPRTRKSHIGRSSPWQWFQFRRSVPRNPPAIRSIIS
ncbi:MAG: hypothetical protein NT069_18485 [Planctomycetota bacterium]|nr:hypothetical protein [Planctomycetota bacterium]